MIGFRLGKAVVQPVKGFDLFRVLNLVLRHVAHHLAPGHFAESPLFDELAVFRLAEQGGNDLNGVCQVYTTVIRGTPIMVQLLIMYFVIFASTRNQIGVAMLTFGINSGAYVSEIIRGGIMSVDQGQTEAGRSLGLPYATTMRFIVIPQAVKNILPALGNELITLMKDTSIVTVIGLRDLTKAAQLVQGKTYQAFMPYVGIALIYLAMVMILSALMGLLERRLRASDNR